MRPPTEGGPTHVCRVRTCVGPCTLEGEIWCIFGYANAVPVRLRSEANKLTKNPAQAGWLGAGFMCARLREAQSEELARSTNSKENASPVAWNFWLGGTLGTGGVCRRGPSPEAAPAWPPSAGAVSLRRFEDKRWRNFHGPQSCSSWQSSMLMASARIDK